MRFSTVGRVRSVPWQRRGVVRLRPVRAFAIVIEPLYAAPIHGMSMTAGLASALIGGTAPAVDQILVTTTGFDIAPGLYVSLVACLALVALWRWPETAFKPTS